MTGPVAHRLAHEPTTSPCARCLTVVALAAGTWHGTEPRGLERPVCDRCAENDDPQGFAQLLAWRRMARPTSRNARA